MFDELTKQNIRFEDQERRLIELEASMHKNIEMLEKMSKALLEITEALELVTKRVLEISDKAVDTFYNSSVARKLDIN